MKLTKKFFKENDQRNVPVNTWFYTETEQAKLEQIEGFFNLGVTAEIRGETPLRLSLEYVDSLDVAVTEGFMVVQATMKYLDENHPFKRVIVEV